MHFGEAEGETHTDTCNRPTEQLKLKLKAFSFAHTVTTPNGYDEKREHVHLWIYGVGGMVTLCNVPCTTVPILDINRIGLDWIGLDWIGHRFVVPVHSWRCLWSIPATPDRRVLHIYKFQY